MVVVVDADGGVVCLNARDTPLNTPSVKGCFRHDQKQHGRETLSISHHH